MQLMSLIDNATYELRGKKKSLAAHSNSFGNSNMNKTFQLSGHKLAYKMNRPKPISLKQDLKKLKAEMKVVGEDHLQDVMTFTRDAANFIRRKETKTKYVVDHSKKPKQQRNDKVHVEHNQQENPMP